MGKGDMFIEICVAENRNAYIHTKEETVSDLCARIMGTTTITGFGMLLL